MYGMRELLFRGKRLDTNEWVYGGYARLSNHTCFSHNLKYTHFIIKDESIDIGIGTLLDYEVIPETVGQYTGLTDKNGKKIFEGDYIVCSQSIESKHFDKHIEMGYVEMKHGAFGLHRKQGYYRPFKDWLEDYEYEIIGNIHDNPEFLKGDVR